MDIRISLVDAETIVAVVEHIHQHKATGTNPAQTLRVVLDELGPLADRLRDDRRAYAANQLHSTL